MTINHIRYELEAARQEVATTFGEIYSEEHGHNLLLMRMLSKQGFAPQTIYDAGGSDGIWSAVASQVFPQARFEVFEPLAEVSEDYHAGRERNALIRDLFVSGRATMHPIALGVSTGTCQMTVYPRSVGSTSITLDHQPSECRALEVPQWAMDDFIAKHQLPLPDLMKLDTQGSELEILRGARKSLHKVSAVLCECWLTRGYGSNTPLWIDIANMLAEYGLRLFDTGWVYRNTSSQRSHTVDMLFLRH
jgi:FkbM family methyltransferase